MMLGISAETTRQIAEQYNNLENAEMIYNSYFENKAIIPIYNKEQLAKVGSGEKVTINGKIYTFSTEAYYALQNDLDLGGVYDSNTDTWSGTKWNPINNEFTGILDGLGHTISGIYFGEDEQTKGLFDELKGTLKNLYIKDSYKIKNMNGLLAGTNNGEIVNCYYEKALIGLKVGDYVNYTPKTGTYSVVGGTYGTGTDNVQSFSTETGENSLKWRIWSINEKTGVVELISETEGQTLTLKGADGYNHAVEILNDLCENLYSGENGAIARSINLEDIDGKTEYNYTKETNYGKKYTPTNKQYPNIYIGELGSTSNGLNDTSNLLKRSEMAEKGTKNGEGITQYSKYSGSSVANTLIATFTWCNYIPEDNLANLGINTVQKGMINLGKGYWVASRSVYAYESNADFDVPNIISEGDMVNFLLFSSDGTVAEIPCAVRPIVTLDKNVTFTKDTEKTKEGITYWNIKF